MNPKYTKILLLIVVTIFILVIADIVNAGQIFLPLITKKASSQSPSPTGTLFIFSSTATTDGDAGRPGMHAICSSEDPQAHFCDLLEIDNAKTKEGVYFAQPLVESWIDYGWYSDTDNCNGWTTNAASPFMGDIIYNGAQDLWGEALCNTTHPALCCKWIP